VLILLGFCDIILWRGIQEDVFIVVFLLQSLVIAPKLLGYIRRARASVLAGLCPVLGRIVVW